MHRLLSAFFWLMALTAFGAHLEGPASEPVPPPTPTLAPAPDKSATVQADNAAAVAPPPADAVGLAGPKRVLVIPVRDQIADPVLYILRRGLKSAGKDDVVVLDMKTPGGSVATTLEIAEALEMFKGRKLTYVNDEALSAGALIASMTDEIYFRPGAVMGAAAAVSSTGEDIGKTMRLKVNSVLLAKVRAWAEGRGRYRGQVLSSMVDEDYEFKIGDTVIKAKGSLLSVNSTEAEKTYGDPPEALLSAGTAGTLNELLDRKFGAGNYRIEKLEVTWSERLAQLLTNWSPILMGLGLLCVFIEFKMPGTGIFGVTGGALLLLVFFGSYVAGLSGHEPVVVFALGLLLVLVELLFFPGVVVVALTGLMFMLGALVWAMADIWPNQPLTFSFDVFVRPLQNLGLGLVVALLLGAALLRYLPRGWFFQRVAVGAAASAPAQIAGGAPQAGAAAALVGARGVVVSGLFPSGQIEIGGRRYEARLEVGAAPAGAEVVVVRVSDFSLVVEIVT